MNKGAAAIYAMKFHRNNNFKKRIAVLLAVPRNRSILILAWNINPQPTIKTSACSHMATELLVSLVVSSCWTNVNTHHNRTIGPSRNTLLHLIYRRPNPFGRHSNVDIKKKMDKILKGILKYRKTYRTEMVEQFKQVADRPEVKNFFFISFFFIQNIK
jgi:hypothetical protein